MTDDTGPDTDEEYDSESIDGRLRNEDDVERTFQIAITKQGGSRREGTFELDPGETRPIPAIGSPGDEVSVEASVNGSEDSATLELDVEESPGKIDGYVYVVYTEDGTIEISFEPAR